MQKYVRDFDPPRVLIHYEVQACQLVDLRHPNAEELRRLASQDWQGALRNGDEPASWQVVDTLRESNEVGLIDPSRKNVGSWHVTLLRWNETDAPRVTRVGEPVAISF